jgi:hypothetical protein
MIHIPKRYYDTHSKRATDMMPACVLALVLFCVHFCMHISVDVCIACRVSARVCTHVLCNGQMMVIASRSARVSGYARLQGLCVKRAAAVPLHSCQQGRLNSGFQSAYLVGLHQHLPVQITV